MCVEVPRSERSVPCSTGLPGICAEGVQQCDSQGNLAGDCIGQPSRSERCDAEELDEDCDGEVNEEGASCVCGDGYLSRGEECEDGGTLGGDRCSPICQNERVRQISTATFQTCVLLHDGRVKCWGYNQRGELGQGDVVNRGLSPLQMGNNLAAIDLGADKTASAVAAGTCAILSNGTVKCWGYNGWGTLGQGDTSDRGDEQDEMGDDLPAVDLGTSFPIKAIATDNHTCALAVDGFLRCWGANAQGQLGLGTTESEGNEPGEMGIHLSTVDLGRDSGVARKAVAVTLNTDHTCAILDKGSVKCWGSNDKGQLGLGDTERRGDEPGEMGDNLPDVDLGTDKTATAISAGGDFTCVILNDGSVKCWGDNQFGQLGLGDTDSRGDEPGEMGDDLIAVDLGVGKTAIAIAAGSNHTCALLNDSSVKCWGANSYGELGQGETSYRGTSPGQMGDNLLPVRIGSGKRAIAIAASAHTCALLDDGSVKCWGPNNSGELGLGDTEARGDEPGEMGDDLPAVKLFSDVW